MRLLPNGSVDLEVNVVRQAYAGPISLQVRGLLVGVTCRVDRVIPEGETFAQLELRTDGNPIVGNHTVEVVALIGDQVVDTKCLTLQVPRLLRD